MRTPSRNESGQELLMEYYNQLYFLDQRFYSPHRTLGIHFHWWHAFHSTSHTSERVCVELDYRCCVPQVWFIDRCAVGSESAGVWERKRFIQHRSTLYSDWSQTGSLDTDWHSERHRCFSEGRRYWRDFGVLYLCIHYIICNVMLCLCLCTGAFLYLQENFSHAPSLDMSSSALSMLVRLMVAQVTCL